MGKKILPVYKMVINPDDTDNTGITIMSIVDAPAIESNFIAYNKDIKFNSDDVIKSLNNIDINYKVTDNEKRIVTGAALIPDKEVYRNLEDVGECLWVFDAQTIELVRDKFHRNKNTSNVNLQHQVMVEDCYLVESYIVNKDKGIYPTGLKDIVDGTWVVSYKIDNDEVWEDIKVNGYYKGFSVQGVVSPVKTEEVSTLTYSTVERYNELLKKIKETVN